MASLFEAADPAASEPSRRARLFWFLVVALGCLVPFLVIDFPPCADLPQHLAQIRLLDEMLGLRPASAMMAEPLAINWIGPGNAIYLPLWIATRIVPPIAAGKVFLYGLLLFQVAVIFHCARKWRASHAQAILASLFLFNASLYWGFLGFLAGFPLFLLWVDSLLSLDGERFAWRPELYRVGLLLGLYAAHSIWFTVGLGLLVLFTALSRPRWQVLLARGACLVPLLALAGFGLLRLTALRLSSGTNTQTQWLTPLTAKLHPGWFVDAALGGLRSSLEYGVVFGALGWVGLGLWTNRRAWREAGRGKLLLVAGLLVLVVFFGPDRSMNALQFSTRFAPMAMILFLLAVPAPRLGRLIPPVSVAACSLSLLAVTTAGWAAFSHQELSGLGLSLSLVTQPSAILGLDYVYGSAVVKGSPYLQLFAYAQSLHGAVPNFSFASHGSALVVYSRPRAMPWTSGLEWMPDRVKPADFAYFDYVLVNAKPEVHATFQRLFHLRPMTAGGRFRLYATDRSAKSR